MPCIMLRLSGASPGEHVPLARSPKSGQLKRKVSWAGWRGLWRDVLGPGDRDPGVALVDDAASREVVIRGACWVGGDLRGGGAVAAVPVEDQGGHLTGEPGGVRAVRVNAELVAVRVGVELPEG